MRLLARHNMIGPYLHIMSTDELLELVEIKKGLYRWNYVGKIVEKKLSAEPTFSLPRPPLLALALLVYIGDWCLECLAYCLFWRRNVAR